MTACAAARRAPKWQLVPGPHSPAEWLPTLPVTLASGAAHHLCLRTACRVISECPDVALREF
jgi:hypothetical protein